MQRVAGKDATKQFWKYHSQGVLNKFGPKLMIGSLESKSHSPVASKPATPATTVEETPKTASTAVIPATTTDISNSETHVKALEPFGELIPFGDPSWYHGVCILPHIVVVIP